MKPEAVMIFAAGFGKRMMPLTADRPKPMVPVAGRPMVDHAFDLALDAGLTRVVLNTHYKAEVLVDHLAGRDVTMIHETPDILDTGGGLLNARTALGGGVVCTLNPDAIWAGPNPLSLAMNIWQPHQMDALLVCLEPEYAFGTTSNGDFSSDPKGRLKRGSGLIFGGAQIINTDRLPGAPGRAFSLNEVWDSLIAEGRCFGVTYPGEWCDVGHPEGIALAEYLLRQSRDV